MELRPEFAEAENNLGIALRVLGQLDEALTHFRRAVELNPTFASAQSNLGQLLIDLGKPNEALPHCEEAARLQPDIAALQHNLGNARRVTGQFTEARMAYLEAIRLDPNLAKSHAHLGLVLQHTGQLDDALVWFKQAVELSPDEADFWEYLAEYYGELEESAEAIPFWERMLALEPKRARAHNGLGWALQNEARATEAVQHYRTAIELQPDFAGAHLSLGGIHEELGELADAEAAFRKALSLQPAYALPHARLATLLRGKISDSDCAALKERLADPELGEGFRARLLFALAHVRDAQRDFAGAAECTIQANSLSMDLAGRRKHDYVPAEHERFVNNLLTVFGAEFFRCFGESGVASRRPVFIFGLPRSGTTLIEQVLASHSRVYGAGELHLARESFEAIPAAVGLTKSPIDSVSGLDQATTAALAAQHLGKLHDLDGGRADRIVDKMPDNYMYIGLLAALFPQATFIHCRRDLRDVAVSCWMTDFRSIRWANEPTHIGTRFHQYCRVMDHWRSLSPVPIHEVDYEDTVADIEGVSRRLLTACGLDWEPGCVEFHRTRRPIRTASVVQVRQPVYRQSVGRWRNYESHFAELFACLPSGKSSPEA